MLSSIHPKLPFLNSEVTLGYYVNQLGFELVADFGNYLIVKKDQIEIHFFKFQELSPADNYGQVYIRTENIDALYTNLLAKKVAIHPNGKLEPKPWKQKEFALLDPDNNLLTFGETISI